MSAADQIKREQANADVDEAVATVPPIEAPAGAASADVKSQMGRKARQAAAFARQSRVRVRVQDDVRVQINGYDFNIPAKQSVMVPEQVQRVLLEAGLI